VSPPDFVASLFGWREKGTPNVSDADSNASVNIATAVMEALGVPPGTVVVGDSGKLLENGVKGWLQEKLTELAPNRNWVVDRKRKVIDFLQYEHLARLQKLIDADVSKTLKTEIGTDYVIAPDVTVGLELPAGLSLHASVSCKWSIRSDRVQNIRHEAVILTRHRRGRQPHIVAVTAEPLPTRIASIARGTGEVDAVYHVALDALTDATATHGSAEQRDVLAELVSQGRLFDLLRMPDVLID
jgi:hypothetical protein